MRDRARLPRARRSDHGLNIPAIAVSVALAAVLFYLGTRIPGMREWLQSVGYAGTFVLGALFAFSFTSLPATALLTIITRSQDPWIAGAAATFGAAAAEMMAFALFRSARPLSEPAARRQRYESRWKAFERVIPAAWQPMAITVVVAACLMFPVLPNEFAAFILARTRTVRTSVVAAIFIVCNAAGLYTIVWLARSG